MKFSGRFQGYHAKSFQKDLVSGLIVGIVAIPLGMAFAIASGVKPEYGLFSTIIAGILISLFGGSTFQIGGPTGAFIPVLFAIVMQYGYENLLIAGFMAGIILLCMGIFKLGKLIQFIPRSVTIGFTAGIAVTIFTGQIANFLGLRNLKQHEAFLDNMKELGMHLGTINAYSVLTAGICLVILLVTPRWFPKIPGSLIGILVSTVIAAWCFPDRIATIGSTYGAIPNSLPSMHWPSLTWENIQHLIKPAFVIAMLGGIESLLSAVVADGMSGTRHNSNRELIGQGIANMVTPLFGGIPATGAIARTATNIRSGAASPLSGVIHGVVVLLILFLFAPYASSIPLASMAPILMVVAWNMSERRAFMHLLKAKSAESLVLVITFVLTVLTDLTTAVETGLILSGIIFVKHMSERFITVKVLPDSSDKQIHVSVCPVHEEHVHPQISMFNVEGALFFGAANLFEKSILEAAHSKPQIIILKMDSVPYMDSTGQSSLESIVKHFKKHESIVLISELQEQPLQMLQKAGLHEAIGKGHFFEHTKQAVHFALSKLHAVPCPICGHNGHTEMHQTAEAVSKIESGSASLKGTPV